MHQLRSMGVGIVLCWYLACFGAIPVRGESPPEVALIKKPESFDWTVWRGPEGNGISRETGLIDSFDAEGGPAGNVAWKNTTVGGRSTPIVMGGKIFMLSRAEPGTTREGERIVCLDVATGKQLWENRFNIYCSEVPDTRVAWSSVVGDPETGRVYAQGVCGTLICADGTSGKTLWSYPMHERFGVLSTYGGRTNFPVLVGDTLVVSAVVIGWGEMARPTHRFIGFDKMTGEPRWFNGTRPLPEDTTYSTPKVCVIDKQPAIVAGSGDGGLWAFQPHTGKLIWEFRLSKRGMDVSPIVSGDQVFMSHSEENLTGTTMGALVAVKTIGGGDITKTNEIWRTEGFAGSKSSHVLVDGRIYAADDSAKLLVFDAKTGEPIGRKFTLGTSMRASLLYADGKLYAFESNGRWWIFTPDASAGVKLLNKGRLPAGEEVHASPIVSAGRVYINTTGGLYCLVDSTKKAGITPCPPAPEQAPLAEDTTPATVQVVPCDVILKPGDTQSFRVRLFNRRGQFLSESPAEFQVDANGKVDAKGSFTADAGAKHVAAYVTAKVGELTGKARIRIIPPLPWAFDFEDVAIDAQRKSGEPTITWVGARYRHVVREVNGNKMMVKVTTIPKGTKSRSFMGPDNLSNYTIEADVLGAPGSTGKAPDVGIINMGYTLALRGQHQDLQIRSWEAQMEQRMGKTVPFAWKPNTLLRMKLEVAVEGGKAICRGKVWPQAEKEPAAWTIEASDSVPQTQGSPGLFGDATGSEIFIDNIKVYANTVK